MRFCGTRGSASFVNAVRPKPTGKMGKDAFACPKNFEPCSPATSLNNTICISSTKDKTKECPITFMKFVSTSNQAQYSNSSDYTILPVDKNSVFVISKTVGDNLPLTSFKVEPKPCLDPHETSVTP